MTYPPPHKKPTHQKKHPENETTSPLIIAAYIIITLTIVSIGLAYFLKTPQVQTKNLEPNRHCSYVGDQRLKNETNHLFKMVRSDWKDTPQKRTVIKHIINRALYNNLEDPLALLEIAHCESRFEPKAQNPNSTAAGLFQYTKPTWEYRNHKGKRTNYKDATKAFMQDYPQNPDWWECNT